MNESLIVTLIDKLDKSGLSELDYDDGVSRLILRRAGPAAASAAGGVSAVDSAGGPHGAIPVEYPAAPEGAETPGAGEIIASPIVGTFYPAPGPDAPPFVRPGSKVKAGDTLCILEAMKMMNRLEAEFDCEIRAVKAASGDLVEFGQALFEVRRPGPPGPGRESR
ncbi:MAG: acetyl-CoA carboxylase biotin carboxyl carrier protein [Treponema sp.]|jgi:acetyl-CoA carboxylase biotin carboxyl carrier protein|nr:acetyl-CoA carboxylase biotin carboxyl carrier protein [Treponema sp.]